MFNVESIYKNRFNEDQLLVKRQLWKILTKEFFQKYVKQDAVILDIAAGYCEFINAIKCSEKIANDISEDVKNFADKDVKILNNSADNIKELNDRSIDVVFVSNFFEHLNSKEEFIKVLNEINRVLKLNGILLILQPNIKYSYDAYWDLIDHILPLSHLSIVEALEICKFNVKTCIPRFLPWRAKPGCSKFMFLLKVYLKIPILWKIFGKHMFIVGEKIK